VSAAPDWSTAILVVATHPVVRILYNVKGCAELRLAVVLQCDTDEPDWYGFGVNIVMRCSASAPVSSVFAIRRVGGNPGTTLGAQRLAAFTYAANIWGNTLTSAVSNIPKNRD
jgi:hypothetical protein